MKIKRPLIQAVTYILSRAFAVGSDHAKRLEFSVSEYAEIHFRVGDMILMLGIFLPHRFTSCGLI